MKPITPTPVPVYRKRCKYATKYKAKRAPTCGCQVCNDKWDDAQEMRNLFKGAKKFEKNARQQDALWREST